MNNNFEFNKIESNNAEQLKPKPYYSANYIGQTQNKADIQKPSQEAENKVEKKEKEVKTQTKAVTTSKLLTTFVAAVSSVVIGVTTISGILPEPTTLTARFEETYATDHEIFYMVEIGDSRFDEQDESGREKMQYEDEDYVIDLTDLYVTLHNDFTNRSEKIEEQFWSGCFENLQENMIYTLEVKYKNNVLVSKTLKTVLQSDYEDDDPDEPYTEPITSDDPDEPYTEPTNSDDPDEPYTEPTNNDDPDEPIMSDGDGDYDPDDPDNPNNYDPDDPDNPDYNEPDDPDNPDGTDDPTNNTGGDNTGGNITGGN